MSDIDWRLAIVLAILFVVTSVVRWRYFRSRFRRPRRSGDGGPPAPPADKE
jgi:hypothetical protein